MFVDFTPNSSGSWHELACQSEAGMKKSDIAKHLARQSGVTEAEAADRLDRVVHEIVSNLRSGKSASLPGLGRFRSGAGGKVRFEREGGNRRG